MTTSFLLTLPLVIEQPFLAPQSAAVTAERAIGANDAMTGDDNANHVGPVGTSDRAARGRNSQTLGHPGIRARFADWNRPENFPGSHLKIRTDRRERNIKFQICP